jgi:hypothetical protein
MFLDRCNLAASSQEKGQSGESKKPPGPSQGRKYCGGTHLRILNDTHTQLMCALESRLVISHDGPFIKYRVVNGERGTLVDHLPIQRLSGSGIHECYCRCRRLCRRKALQGYPELLLQLRVCAWQMELVEAESDTSPNPPHKIQKDSNNPENRTWFSNPKSSSATPQPAAASHQPNLQAFFIVQPWRL